jgi:hypothetical protein
MDEEEFEEEEFEGEFEDDELDGLFSDYSLESETEIKKPLLEFREPSFIPPRNCILGEDLLEISYPQKKRLGPSAYVAFRVLYSSIRAYEVLEVKAFKDRTSIPIDVKLTHKKYDPIELGEFYIFGLSADETDWYVFNLFIPKNQIQKTIKILREKIKRPPLTGVTHYGNLAAIRYILDKCEILHEHDLLQYDWAKSSMFMRPRRDKYEKYVPKGKETTPPKLIICKEGFAQIFSEETPTILKQMSTFWPWNMIKKISEDNDHIKFEWIDELYTFKQLITEDKTRNKLLRILKKALKNGKNENFDYAPFIRANSFPSKDEDSWKTVEPYGCEASRKGLPPLEV